MKFRTEYNAGKSSLTLDSKCPVVLAGSCFSQNISAKMHEHLWKGVNPFGTLYNPLSIYMAIDIMTDEENGLQRMEDSLFQANGLWNSRWFDSSFSSVEKADCMEEFRLRRKDFIESLSAGKVLIVTFGTSICYFPVGEDKPVGNCHKQPSSLFYRRRLSISEITGCWNSLIEKLRLRFPGLNIIFTVSPVRHLKDGFEGNSRSKAILQLAVEDLCSQNTDCHYFPAYEIMNDDLRDYRFYAADLAHPSDEAIEYIWQKFTASYLDEQGKELLTEGSRQYKALHHRPKTGALGKPLK